MVEKDRLVLAGKEVLRLASTRIQAHNLVQESARSEHFVQQNLAVVPDMPVEVYEDQAGVGE